MIGLFKHPPRSAYRTVDIPPSIHKVGQVDRATPTTNWVVANVHLRTSLSYSHPFYIVILGRILVLGVMSYLYIYIFITIAYITNVDRRMDLMRTKCWHTLSLHLNLGIGKIQLAFF